MLNSVRDIKVAQLNDQLSQIQVLLLYKFELNHNAREATKIFEGLVKVHLVRLQ